MNEPNQQQKPAPQKQPAERTPIRIEKLVFSAANPNGIKIPFGPDGKSEKIVPFLIAGVSGDGEKTEIEHLPWLRVFRVTKTKRVTRSGEGKDAKEIVSWVPMGPRFNIPETWAVSVPAED